MSSPSEVAKVLSRPESLPSLFQVKPRTLLPLHPPPSHRWVAPPVLPSPLREPAPKLLRELYDLSTHILTAAYPRSTPYVPEPSLNTSRETTLESKVPRREQINKAATNLIIQSNRIAEGSFHAGTSDARGRLLWSVANRYLRKGVQGKELTGGKKRITLVFFHATGFPKEIWETVISDVVEELSEHSGKGVRIDEVWSLDAVQHGDSALINRPKLGTSFTWADSARDILNFLLHYLPDPKDDTASIHLPLVSDIETELRIEKGFSNREVIAIGHSFGACALARAAVHQPKLFNALILADPVILVPKTDFRDFIRPYVIGAMQRREVWPNVNEARKSFVASPFFKAWNPTVLDLYLECGLIEDGGIVRLKTPGIQEAVVFSGYRHSFEVYDLLGSLDDRVQLHWVLGAKEPYPDGDAEARNIRVWRRPTNCSNVEITTAGHLVVQEAPREVASEICKVLWQRYGQASSTTGGWKTKL